MIEFSEKQAALVRILKRNELKRINILEGAVRSGKTWISLIVFALWVATMPKDATFLMVAKTLTSLKRNCLDLLQGLVGENNFTYSLSSKQGILFGRVVYLEGVNDARAEGKIRGMTLTGAYADELTLFQKDFVEMLLSRLSMPGAKLIATTNPDNPAHFVNTDFLQREHELDLLHMRFLIDDNPFLDSAYVEALKKEYVGVFYKRFILGEWVVADGLCFEQFANTPERWYKDAAEENINFISVGVDFGGTSSKTTFTAVAFHGNYDKIGVIKDYKLDGAKGTIDANVLNNSFLRFIKELQAEYKAPIRYAFCDCAETYLITGIKMAVKSAGIPIQIGDSDKGRILDRIVCTNTLFNTDRLYLLRSCEQTANALRSAMWDEKAAAKGEDKRLDNFSTDIDACDSFEYAFSRFIPRLTPRK